MDFTCQFWAVSHAHYGSVAVSHEHNTLSDKTSQCVPQTVAVNAGRHPLGRDDGEGNDLSFQDKWQLEFHFHLVNIVWW
jgi:hypothetical protein